MAGPAVTLVIASGLYLVLSALNHAPLSLHEAWNGGYSFLSQVMAINWKLLAFNFIPAIPLDGGRVLRSLLAMRRPHAEATRIASRIGRAIAAGIVTYGLFHQPFNVILVLIGVFVYFAAGAELAFVESRAMARDIPLGDVMLTQFQTLAIHARLEAAAAQVEGSEQQEFPVVDNLGRVEGLLTRDHLKRGLELLGSAGTVGEAMAAGVPALAPELPLQLDIYKD